MFYVWLGGIPGLGFLNWYLTRQMRRNLSPGLAQFRGYTDWRLEGRRAAFLRDPTAYNEVGRKYRRRLIVVELLVPLWFLSGIAMVLLLLRHTRL
jgi:hypothetical protein